MTNEMAVPDRTDALLDALGDHTRRAILEQLKRRSRSVGELTEALPVSQPAVSQHLKVLREAKLVAAEKKGTRRVYHLDPVGLRALREYVESFWTDVLDAFRDQWPE